MRTMFDMYEGAVLNMGIACFSSEDRSTVTNKYWLSQVVFRNGPSMSIVMKSGRPGDGKNCNGCLRQQQLPFRTHLSHLAIVM